MRGLTACFATAVAAALLGGCGGGSANGTSTPAPADAAAWVDPEGEEPLVGSVAVDPADGTVFLSTNRGLYRVAEGAEPEQVTGRLETPRGSGDISGQLVVSFAGPGEMLGSGHPPTSSGLPEALGLIRSTDGGKSWESVSELGTADFHVLERSGDRLVGGLYGESQVLLSEDEGRTWRTRAAPGPTTDLAVDPDESSRWVASTPDQLFLSEDEGRTWRPREPVGGSYLVWAAGEALYRVDPAGEVFVSTDRGRRWEQAGDIGDAAPAAIAAAGPDEVYVATSDGGIQRSTDAGRSWTPFLEPEPAAGG